MKSRLTLALTATLLALAVAEVGVRATGRYQSYGEETAGFHVFSHGHEPSPLPLAALTRKPHTEFRQAQEEFVHEGRTNAVGVRDFDYAREKPSGVRRVFVLGDSFVEGVGATLEESWAKVLEQTLAERPGGARVEVLVGGSAGMDPVDNLELLKQRLLPYGPDLILAALNNSDLSDLILRGGPERFAPNAPARFGRWRHYLELGFAASHLLRVFLLSGLGWSWSLLSPAEQREREGAVHGELVATFEAIREVSKAAGAELAVVIHEVGPEPAPPDEGPLTDLRRDLVERGFEVIDLRPAMARTMLARSPEHLYWPIDGHCTPAGYALMGRAVAQQLELRDKLRVALE